MVPHRSDQNAFVDTNVLAHIVGESRKGLEVVSTLRKSSYKIVTFRKCVYELYSMIKGTTKTNISKKNHPLKRLLTKELNDIGQQLFKKAPNADAVGTSYYWYNLCEEWRGWDFFESSTHDIDRFVAPSQQKEAFEHLEQQRKFVKWKNELHSIFSKIDNRLEKHRVSVVEYIQVFGSDWYVKEGVVCEQELATNSLIPNEDFELVIAALYMQSRVFVTEDEKNLLWRGGLSLGLGTSNISFCCPERLKEAIEDRFSQRFYRRR